MNIVMTHSLAKDLSEADLEPYLHWSGGNRAHSCELREVNSLALVSLFVTFEPLKTTISDKMHSALSVIRGGCWFEGEGVQVTEHQCRALSEARAELDGGECPRTDGNIVACLPFWVWATMLSPEHEELWSTHLHRIVSKGEGIPRDDAFRLLTPLVNLRHDVWRHRPVLHLDLAQHYAEIVLLARWFSPTAAEWCSLGDFEKIHSDERIALAR